MLYGFGPHQTATFEAWLGRIHPEDRQKVLALNRAMLEPAGKNSWDVEFRILHPANGERWMAGLGHLYRDKAGRPLQITGITFDINANPFAPIPPNIRFFMAKFLLEAVTKPVF